MTGADAKPTGMRSWLRRPTAFGEAAEEVSRGAVCHTMLTVESIAVVSELVGLLNGLDALTKRLPTTASSVGESRPAALAGRGRLRCRRPLGGGYPS
jgi:hypothetical protein